ncbi:OmpA family protein [Dongia sedimenti]|uniref:OmpA family protein n=1 Tax=Dongia sedimenti TaxID=3064282 RepID=A0ABU0YXM2_9PROT|nr:OmpA family protein [Rhodospirillaceae bacterium R-7]
MFDVCKSKVLQVKAMGSALIGNRLERVSFARAGRWLPATALLVIAGCSWFDEEPTPPAPSQQAKATTPAPGEGEAMAGEEAKTPDINSVPNEAPKPSIVNLDQAQEGLGSDSGNAQHTDETLTMPEQSAARPEAPATETPQTAQVGATAPESSETTEVAPPPSPTPAPQPEPAPVATPLPAPEPVTQVAQAGTPQPGSKPFEPNGPLALAPGSLSRTQGESEPTNIAAIPLPGSNAAPLTAMAPTTAPAPSADGVSVDYSVLSGLQGGAPTSYRPATGGVMPVQGYAPSGNIPGVGQAVGYVYFGNGSSRLSSADRQVLQQVAQLQRIQGGVLRIIGHASARTGNMEALEQQSVNRDVSLERATAVARALVEYGVQPILVQVAAAGDDQTLYAESTPAGEAGNRRAEVYLSQN